MRMCRRCYVHVHVCCTGILDPPPHRPPPRQTPRASALAAAEAGSEAASRCPPASQGTSEPSAPHPDGSPRTPQNDGSPTFVAGWAGPGPSLER
eukprot:gene17929-biopygen3897